MLYLFLLFVWVLAMLLHSIFLGYSKHSKRAWGYIDRTPMSVFYKDREEMPQGIKTKACHACFV